MPDVAVEHLEKRFGATRALCDLSLAARERELIVVLGPTGAGKTTLLRIIAGLERPDSGHVLISGRDVTSDPPAMRDVAMVFQNFSLYPRLTVRQNLEFPLRAPARRVADAEIRRRVEWAAEILNITRLLDRRPGNLSGGEQQRVAIGRTIVREPRLFLFDEPLGNLDAKLRESMRLELFKLQRRLQTTMLFVTHDHVEAMSMADRIAVVHQGRLCQVGTPDEIYDRPTSVTVARQLGSPAINLLKADRDGRLVTAFGGSLALRCAGGGAAELRIGVRPHDVHVAPATDGRVECGRIELVENLGADHVLVIVRDGERLRVTVPPSGVHRPGQAVHISAEAQKLHLFDGRTGERASVA